jgi:hypothetical protein
MPPRCRRRQNRSHRMAIDTDRNCDASDALIAASVGAVTALEKRVAPVDGVAEGRRQPRFPDDRVTRNTLRTGRVGLPGLTATFLRHRDRMNEVAEVLARYGFVAWVERGGGLLDVAVVPRAAPPGYRLPDGSAGTDVMAISPSHRWPRATCQQNGRANSSFGSARKSPPPASSTLSGRELVYIYESAYQWATTLCSWWGPAT